MSTQTPSRPLSFDQFQEILAEVLVVDRAKLAPEAYFITDLAVDSIRMVELLLRLEEMGFKIPQDAAWEIQTVGDAYDFYLKHARAG